MHRILVLVAFLLLSTLSLISYLFLTPAGLGWMVILALVLILAGLLIILRRQAIRPETKLVNQANRHYLDGNYNAALTLYHQLLEKSPNQSQFYNLMATCYANQEQFEQALSCYQRVADLQPQDADAFSNIASIRVKMLPLDEALVVASLDQAWKLIPQQPRRSANYYTLLKIAFTEMEIERFERAIQACDEALRLQSLANTPRLVRGLCRIVAYGEEPEQVERGRHDLIQFLTNGFDTDVSLKLEIHYMLKAREFLLETGGIPEDLKPRISKGQN